MNGDALLFLTAAGIVATVAGMFGYMLGVESGARGVAKRLMRRRGQG